jgi:hypothetical protein
MYNEDCKDYGILEIHSSTKNCCVYLTDQEYVSHYEPQRDTIIPISTTIHISSGIWTHDPSNQAAKTETSQYSSGNLLLQRSSHISQQWFWS